MTFAGFRTGSIILACSFWTAASSDTPMTLAATLSSRALTVAVPGYTREEEDAVRIAFVNASWNNAYTRTYKKGARRST